MNCTMDDDDLLYSELFVFSLNPEDELDYEEFDFEYHFTGDQWGFHSNKLQFDGIVVLNSGREVKFTVPVQVKLTSELKHNWEKVFWYH